MKVGDYVRLDRCQGINKIDEEDEIGTFYLEDVIGDEWGDETFRLDTNDVIKSSPNIIDLIEVGDYVNGYLVKDIDYAFDDVVMNNKNARIVPYIDCNKDKYIDDIKSIVTKEQFSQMEYKLGE